MTICLHDTQLIRFQQVVIIEFTTDPLEQEQTEALTSKQSIIQPLMLSPRIKLNESN